MKTRALAAALVATAAVMSTGCTQPRPPAEFTLVGSFQPAVGCATEWDVSCGETGMTPTDGRHSVELDLPAGGHEFKVTRTGGWEENYGARGARDGDNLALSLPGPAKVRFTYDPAGHVVRAEPPTPAGAELPEDADLAQASLRSALTRERIDFVMSDRFANGDPGNDAGGLAGDRRATGLDPTHKAYYHGGDLRGLTEKLDYVQGLGATAIWITPPLVNKPVQGEGDNASAGYHGYWITDFTQVDPHLGGTEALRELVDAAHARGMKVFMDVVANHTADVIARAEDRNAYVGKTIEPYKDAQGNEFDDRALAGSPDFPALDAATSFPYTPVFPRPEDATVKAPEWLNDPTMYHNRGNSTFSGESDEYGDFFGLDDLFTERPEVVEGMSEVYAEWVRFGIDGFRIDTVKHVNIEFWQVFAERMRTAAAEAGNDDFFMFGEVYSTDATLTSRYTTTGKLPAALDFGFQEGALKFARGTGTQEMAAVWAEDDRYTDADSNAYQLPTFVGNHDMGRVAGMLRGAVEGDELLARTALAHDLMFLSRGQPVVYYGDEQGLVGSGGDQDARQSLFATQVEQYAQEQVVGAEPGARDRYDIDHPLYRRLAALAALREEHPALADGAQITRQAGSGPGVLAFSRIDRATGTEYVVALNNSVMEREAKVTTWSPGVAFESLAVGDTPGGPGTTAAADGALVFPVPPLSAVVLRGTAPMPQPDAAPTVGLDLAAGSEVKGRVELEAAVEASGFTEVSFWVRPLGVADWQPLGTDDNPDFRVFHDTRELGPGAVLEYRAVVHDLAGRRAAASTWVVTG